MAAALKPDLAYGIKVGHINHEFMRHSVGDTLNVAVFAYLDINLDTHTHTQTQPLEVLAGVVGWSRNCDNLSARLPQDSGMEP